MFEGKPFKQDNKAKPKTLKEKVSEALEERRRMSPKEREEDRKARMQEYIHGKKIELTPEEKESQKKREERSARLQDSI